MLKWAPLHYAGTGACVRHRQKSTRLDRHPHCGVTVDKMMKFSVPRGYVRSRLPVRPKLDAFIAIIDKMLADDQSRP